jgi:tripartite-type tricarboxylate transporter receptor subunit TctC
VDGVAPSLPVIQSGRFRALAKLNSRPLPALPDIQPLAVAAGLPELEDISTWCGLVAPAGTSPAIIEKIQREIAKMYADPVIVERLAKSGITAATSSTAEFAAFFKREANRWDKVFKESGIKLE